MKDYILRIQAKEHLTNSEIEGVMRHLMSGEADKQDVVDFLAALNDKGPTVDEITGAAKILRKFSEQIQPGHPVVLDTCGTGGDQKHTFNISTIVAVVVAGAGVIVAKHGNRSVSSKCGSADVLEALGVNLAVDKQTLKECLDKIGIAFLFAQKHHPAMRHVADARKTLGTKTIFNILGPLINPAGATHQMMGVYSRDLVEPIACVLRNLGLKRALVVHGEDGLDEVTITGKTFVSEWNGKEILSYDFDPQEFGIERAEEKDFKGSGVSENVAIARGILSGAMTGPKRDIVLINAACALYAAEKVSSIKDGLVLARASIDEGKARRTLERLVAITQKK